MEIKSTDSNNIFSFLRKLTKNNNKEWMDKNRSVYLKAKEEFIEIVDLIINEISKFDENIKNLNPKSCIFRINRDVRFSKDKTPYKKNFGAFFSKGGRHSGYAGYYIHMEPNNRSMIAGGMYEIDNYTITKIRKSIDQDPENIKKILKNLKFKNLFGELKGAKLKSAPRGYTKDNPNIELLKMKHFIVSHTLDDNKLLKSPGFVKDIVHIFRQLSPLVEYLNFIKEK